MEFDSESYYRLFRAIYKRVDNEFDSLSDAERVFLYVDWLDMQVHNGGWHQWYHNWPAEERRHRIEDTIDALSRIKAVDTIILLERAIELLDQDATASDAELLELNEKLWAQPDDLAMLTLNWANLRPQGCI